MIADLAELQTYLAQVQATREDDVRCELTPALSACLNDTALTMALVAGLPMAQGIKPRIVRARGRGIVLTAKVRYREAVRMLAGESLSADETAALSLARQIAADFLALDAEERFHGVYKWVCRHVCYVHTAPGQKGYERLVGASGALLDGQANCQGFADALYLLCGLCGIPCEYRCGLGRKRLHVWNSVCLDGEWRDADASKAARSIAD